MLLNRTIGYPEIDDKITLTSMKKEHEKDIRSYNATEKPEGLTGLPVSP